MKKFISIFYLIGLVALLGISCKKDTKITPQGPLQTGDSAYGKVKGFYEVTVFGGDSSSMKTSYVIRFDDGKKPRPNYCTVGNLRINEHKLIPYEYSMGDYSFYDYELPNSQNETLLNNIWGGEQEFEMDGNLYCGFDYTKIKFKTPKIFKLYSPEPVDSNYYYLFPPNKDYLITWPPDSNFKEVKIFVDYYGPWQYDDYPDSMKEYFEYTQVDNGSFLITSSFMKKFPPGSLFWIHVYRGKEEIIRQNYNRMFFSWMGGSSLAFLSQ